MYSRRKGYWRYIMPFENAKYDVIYDKTEEYNKAILDFIAAKEKTRMDSEASQILSVRQQHFQSSSFLDTCKTSPSEENLK